MNLEADTTKLKTTSLTLKQQLFVIAYLGEARGNGVQAARIAGYKGTDATLRSVASENLTKPNIAAEVSRQAHKVLEPEEILNQVSIIAEAPITERIRTGEKLKALDMLGKCHGLFNEHAPTPVAEKIDRRELAVILATAIKAVNAEETNVVAEDGEDCSD